VTVGFVRSVCPSACRNSAGMDFHETWQAFLEICRENSRLLKSDKNNGYFTCCCVYYINCCRDDVCNNLRYLYIFYMFHIQTSLDRAWIFEIYMKRNVM